MTESKILAKQIKRFLYGLSGYESSKLTYICGVANISRGHSLPDSYSQFTAILTVKVNCKQTRTFPLPAAMSTP